jgi:hypothetical protein
MQHIMLNWKKSNLQKMYRCSVGDPFLTFGLKFVGFCPKDDHEQIDEESV